MLRSIRHTCLAVASLLSAPAHADEAFVEANAIGILYHELAHAVIDIEEVPIFGQEEDAADVFSIFLVDALFEPGTSQQLAYDIALGFWSEAISRDDQGGEIAWWDVHGPDEQRFFNTVCIFYGADPETREDFARDLDLPEDRAAGCAEEFDQANAAWGWVLDDMVAAGGGTSLRFEGGDGSLTAQTLEREVDELNRVLSLSEPLVIRMDTCGEPNAFYDPEQVEIVYCTEFEEHLLRLAE